MTLPKPPRERSLRCLQETPGPVASSAVLEGGVTTRRRFEERQRVREERQRRAVEAVVTLARKNGLRVEEPTVLNDLFSLMVHLKPAPVVARVATCMPKLRMPIEGWLEREISVTTYLAEQGAPVVVPSQELPPGPHERDGFPISYWTYVEPDPDPDYQPLLSYARRPSHHLTCVPGRAADALRRRPSSTLAVFFPSSRKAATLLDTQKRLQHCYATCYPTHPSRSGTATRRRQCSRSLSDTLACLVQF